MAEPTADQIIQALRDVVAEAGRDYVYPDSHRMDDIYGTCRYVWDGKPDCIAARVFVKLGVPVEKLMQYEGDSCNRVWGVVFIPSSENNASEILRVAQVAQDGDRSWGEALDRGEEKYNGGPV